MTDDHRRFEEYVGRLANDFEFFSQELWEAVGLPELAEHQRQMARWLQTGPRRRGVRAFRGASKTWVTLAYCIWRLFKNPDDRIMLVSKSEKHSKDSLHMVRKWIGSVPWLAHLAPDKEKNQRDSAVQFDVGPSKSDRTPSFSAYGIGGQLTGARSTCIVSDDVETAQNTLTLEMRQRLREEVKEFENILIPGGDIVVLGTPHHEESLYDKLVDGGYAFRSWPARYPTEKEQVKDVSPDILEAMARGAVAGESTWPTRFDVDELMEREASAGRSTFAMQYMMITTLGDELRYPLTLRDLIVFPVQRDKAPVTIAWGQTNDRGGTTRCQDIVSLGFGNDGFFAPIMYDNDWAPYTGTKMWIDPSGRGVDKTAYAVISHCHGFLYVKACAGIAGGYGREVLEELAAVARTHRVREIIVEDNFGQGMFAELFRPVIHKYFEEPSEDFPGGWGASVDTQRVTMQKELRIIQALEAPMNQHRIVVHPDVAANQDLQRQITRLTRQRNCLQHDDELDALASCVASWHEVMATDITQSKQRHEEAQFEAMLQEHYKKVGGLDRSPKWFDHTGGKRAEDPMFESIKSKDSGREM